VKTYLTIIGFAFLTLAAYLAARRLNAQLRGETAVGRIQGHEVRTSEDGTSYVPVVEFTDSKGGVHRFTSCAGGPSPSPAVGAGVRVRYLPSDPRVAFIQSLLHMWAAPVACGVLGAAALLGRSQL
jgi:hypothetical protein